MAAYDFDVCIIGSGAGAGPIAYELSKSGHSVVVLEKGPWFTEKDFTKDEIACCRRSVFTPNLKNERHVIEDLDEENEWAKATFGSYYIREGLKKFSEDQFEDAYNLFQKAKKYHNG